MVSAHKAAFGICRKTPGPPSLAFSSYRQVWATQLWERGNCVAGGARGLRNPRLLWLRRRGPATLHTTRGGQSSSCRQLAQSLPSVAPVYSIPRMTVTCPHLCLTLSLTLKQLLVGHVIRPGARSLLTGPFLSSICSDVQDSKETLVLKGAALCGVVRDSAPTSS